MTGTEKQLTWANDIINNARAQLDACEQATKQVYNDHDQDYTDAVNGYTIADVENARKNLEILVGREDLTASWVIDNRHKFTGMKDLLRRHHDYAATHQTSK